VASGCRQPESETTRRQATAVATVVARNRRCMSNSRILASGPREDVAGVIIGR
jgi:hypothetical protein